MTQPSGWYDDPQNPENLRYWDGVTWTAHTTPKKSPTADQSTIGLPQDVPPAAAQVCRHAGSSRGKPPVRG